jgi:hypothetical protein
MYTSLLLAFLVLSGGKEPAPTEPAYEFHKLVKGELKLVAVKDKERTVFVVTHPFGMGGAIIKLKGGEWPENVVLRFQDFRSLENIRITTDRINTEGSHHRSGDFPFFFLDAKGQMPFEVLDDKRATGRLRIVVEIRDGNTDVILPKHFLAGSGQIRVNWIDCYRK